MLLTFCVSLNDAEDQLTDDNAADNAFLEDYATNAALTTEERKIVALLERIENKFSTLGDDEKVEFVKKIASYQDRFATTLAKVETIPGSYGLNVPFLRTNLGIPSIAAEEDIEEFEIYEDFTVSEDKIELNDQIPEVGVSVDQSEVLARKAAAPPVSQMPKQPEETTEAKSKSQNAEITIDDLYSLTLQLTNLIMIQMMSNKPQHPAPFHPVHIPAPPVPSYNPVYNPRNTFPRPPMPHFAAPQFRRPIRQRPVRRNNKQNSKNKSRKRRSAPKPKMTYQEWYNNVYIPYLNRYKAEMTRYEEQVRAYNLAQLQAHIPTEPFGPVTNSLSNPYFEYSKKAYNNFLHEQVEGSDPQSVFANAYGKWKCEKDSTKDTVEPTKIAENENCWNSATSKCIKHIINKDCDDGATI